MEYSKSNSILGIVGASFGACTYIAHSLSNGGNSQNLKSITDTFNYIIEYIANFKIELTGQECMRYSILIVCALLIFLYALPQSIMLLILLLVLLFLSLLCFDVQLRTKSPRINRDATFDANKVLERLAEKRRKNGSVNGS